MPIRHRMRAFDISGRLRVTFGQWGANKFSSTTLNVCNGVLGPYTISSDRAGRILVGEYTDNVNAGRVALFNDKFSCIGGRRLSSPYFPYRQIRTAMTANDAFLLNNYPAGIAPFPDHWLDEYAFTIDGDGDLNVAGVASYWHDPPSGEFYHTDQEFTYQNGRILSITSTTVNEYAVTRPNTDTLISQLTGLTANSVMWAQYADDSSFGNRWVVTRASGVIGGDYTYSLYNDAWVLQSAFTISEDYFVIIGGPQFAQGGDGNLYIPLSLYSSSTPNGEVRVYSPSGVHLDSLRITDDLFTPKSCYWDSWTNRVIVSDWTDGPATDGILPGNQLSATYNPATNRAHLVDSDAGIIRARVFDIAPRTFSSPLTIGEGSEPDIVLKPDQRSLLACWKDENGDVVTADSTDGGRSFS